jgi:hypothetical protein
MEKEFIPYEQALALKELKFDFLCLAVYQNKGLLTYARLKPKDLGCHAVNEKGVCSAPLYQQAFGWFRDKHDLQSIVIPFAESSIDENSKTLYYPIINKKQFYGFINQQEEIGYKMHEEAELECLKKLIETVKNK